jgi:hypothetical protein
VLARRLVADRCLYGVDKNPMAVEMAKLSMWLITLAKDRPFSFIDHALRCAVSAHIAGCPRPESNQRTRFRKPLLYPLSYGGVFRRFAGISCSWSIPSVSASNWG